MYPQPRLLASGALAVVLALFAVAVDTPLLLVGAATVSGWIIARQVAFAVELERTVDDLSVTQDLERTRLRADDTVGVTLTATLEESSAIRLSLEGGVPMTANTEGDRSGASPSVTLTPDRTAAIDTRPVSWPVSGRHEFDAVTVTATDSYFRETVTIGDPPTVTVDPHDIDRIHVGAAGERFGTAYGDHESGRLDAGDDPAEPREYVPGDTADKIDWKATARLGTTYVREYETETDRRTTLVVDHRTPLADGPTGETKFDHLRDVALATAERTRRRGDSVGLVTVDDDGISTQLERTTAGNEYRTIRQRLLDLEPPKADSSAPARRLTGDEARQRLADLTSNTGNGVTNVVADGSTVVVGTDAHHDEPFAATLCPFYEERANGIDRVSVDSLADGVRAAVNKQQQRRRTVIFTDDAWPGELRETVSIARSRGNEVLVFLAPTVLYDSDDGDETGGTAVDSREGTFDRYVDFEELRRDLARMDRVTALEVGPDERFSAVLAAGGAGGDRR